VAETSPTERPAWFGNAVRSSSVRWTSSCPLLASLAFPGSLIGSVARGEPGPADLDLAVIVANLKEAVPHVSLASRRLSQITTSRVFVFDTAETTSQNLPASSLRRRSTSLAPSPRPLRARQSGRCSTLTSRLPSSARHPLAHDLFRPECPSHKQSSVFPSFLMMGSGHVAFMMVMSNLRRPSIQKASTSQCRRIAVAVSAENPPRGSARRHEQVATNANCALFR